MTEEKKTTFEFTEKQWCMVAQCIGHISAYQREHDDEDEQTLKEVAKIFGAEFVPQEEYWPDDDTEEEDEESKYTIPRISLGFYPEGLLYYIYKIKHSYKGEKRI